MRRASAKDNTWYVETIRAKKIVNGKERFLVKWHNYDEEENTWEPRENLNFNPSDDIVIEEMPMLPLSPVSDIACGSNSSQKKEWIIEKVIKKRKINGRTEYLIKWEGFNSEFNSWEPKEHLNYDPDVDSDLNEEQTYLKTAKIASDIITVSDISDNESGNGKIAAPTSTSTPSGRSGGLLRSGDLKKSTKNKSSVKNNNFYVEKIEAKRYVNGQKEYYIKWLYFDRKHNTWVAEKDLNFVPDSDLEADDDEDDDNTDDDTAESDTSKQDINEKDKNTTNPQETTQVYPEKLTNISEDFEGYNLTALQDNNDDENNKNKNAAYFAHTTKLLVDSFDETKSLEEISRESLVLFEEKKMQADEIIGAKRHTDGELLFLVKWKNNGTDIISSEVAIEKCARVVIQFYQSHVQFD
jgi:hypothetical protein